jgi:NADH-quinone oxidoreductase subunit M
VRMDLPIISIMIFLPLGSSLVVYLAGRSSIRAARICPLIVSVAVLGLSLYAYALMLLNGDGGTFFGSQMIPREGPWPWIPTLGGLEYHVGMDGLNAPLVLITAFLTVLVVLGSWDLITTKQPVYYGLIMLFEGSMIGVFTSINLILFYVFWELVLIPMFFFIGIWGGTRRKYAAMKFIIFTYVGSTVMLLAIIGLYLFSTPHTFDMLELYGKVPFWLQIWASAATFVGFGVKLPVVPFHTWLPDAHVEAPAPISVFLAGLLLKMGGYGFLRVNIGLFPQASNQFAWFFIGIGLLTMFYGAIVAMTQKDLKRMIALTSINHMGFVLLGAFTANVYGISGAVFQMFNHATAIGILFMLTGYIHEQAGTRDITLLKGLKVTMPRTATLIVLGSLAAMGVPIYSSFISEYMVIVGAISFSLILVVAVLIPVLTVAYFLWMIRRTVTSQPSAGAAYHDMSMFSASILFTYLIPLIILLIFPSLLLNLVDPLSQVLAALMRGA